MRNEFTAIVERDGPWHIAYCAEVPGANCQGEIREERLASLREAITLILEYRREESITFRSVHSDHVPCFRAKIQPAHYHVIDGNRA